MLFVRDRVPDDDGVIVDVPLDETVPEGLLVCDKDADDVGLNVDWRLWEVVRDALTD